MYLSISDLLHHVLAVANSEWAVCTFQIQTSYTRSSLNLMVLKAVCTFQIQTSYTCLCLHLEIVDAVCTFQFQTFYTAMRDGNVYMTLYVPCIFRPLTPKPTQPRWQELLYVPCIFKTLTLKNAWLAS